MGEGVAVEGDAEEELLGGDGGVYVGVYGGGGGEWGGGGVGGVGVEI